jgi:murein DD-endopeptidase MepM/ murein hydrolase activator NlpD
MRTGAAEVASDPCLMLAAMNESRLGTAEASQIMMSLPFTGRWLAQNSPARRVPSHGIDLFGERYAIDFVAVDHRGRTAAHRDWRTFFAAEPAERFFAYGQPILAPADGEIVDIHDGEPDHSGRRSQLALLPYMAGQAQRLRLGVGAIAGNFVTIALPGGMFAALAHLRNGSFRVAVGDRVVAGQPIAECGNSGNSTQPHVHVQVMDGRDLSVARGVPVTFQRFREWSHPSAPPRIRQSGIPGESAVVEPLTAPIAQQRPGTRTGPYPEPPTDPADATRCEGCE